MHPYYARKTIKFFFKFNIMSITTIFFILVPFFALILINYPLPLNYRLTIINTKKKFAFWYMVNFQNILLFINIILTVCRCIAFFVGWADAYFPEISELYAVLPQANPTEGGEASNQTAATQANPTEGGEASNQTAATQADPTEGGDKTAPAQASQGGNQTAPEQAATPYVPGQYRDLYDADTREQGNSGI